MTDDIVIVKLGKRFTLTIPKEIRERFPLKEGHRLKMIRKPLHLELHLLDDDPHKKLSQLLRGIEYNSSTINQESEDFLFSETRRKTR